MAHKVLRWTGELGTLAEQMLTPRVFSNEATRHGIITEPVARDWYSKTNNVTVHELGLVIHPDQKWFACSPDGLIEKPNGVQHVLLFHT